MGHHLSCPDCGVRLEARRALQRSETLQIVTEQCRSHFCGALFYTFRTTTHRLSFGEWPTAANLPVAPRAMHSLLCQQDDSQQDWVGGVESTAPASTPRWPRPCGMTALNLEPPSTLSRPVCPDCGGHCRVRNSIAEHPLLRTEYLECINSRCGSTFRGEREITYRINTSGQLNPFPGIPYRPDALHAVIERLQNPTPQRDWINDHQTEVETND